MSSVTSSTVRNDTLIVGPIEEDLYFAIAGSINESFDIFISPLINNGSIEFYQAPIPSICFTAKVMSYTYESGITNINAIIKVFSTDNISSFLGYLSYNDNGLFISQTEQIMSLTTSDPSSYQYPTLLSSVRYMFTENFNILITTCASRNFGIICTSTSQSYVSSGSFVFMMIPVIFYGQEGCQAYTKYTDSILLSSVMLSQCYYVDFGSGDLSARCEEARTLSAFSTKSDCENNGRIGKYFYSYDDCGSSFQFTDLQGNQVQTLTSIGTCSEGTCTNNGSVFSCPSKPDITIGDDTDTTQDTTQDDSLNIAIVIIFLILFIVIVVIVVLVITLLIRSRK